MTKLRTLLVLLTLVAGLLITATPVSANAAAPPHCGLAGSQYYSAHGETHKARYHHRSGTWRTYNVWHLPSGSYQGRVACRYNL